MTPDDVEIVCVECGNDLACEGYDVCSDCLEALDYEGDDHALAHG